METSKGIVEPEYYILRNLTKGEMLRFSPKYLEIVMVNMFNGGQSIEATADSMEGARCARNGEIVTNGVFEVYRNDLAGTQLVSPGQKALNKALQNAKRANRQQSIRR